MLRHFLIGIAFCSCLIVSTKVSAVVLTLKWDSQKAQNIRLEQVIKLSPSVEVRVMDHMEKKEVTFRAVPLRKLLDNVFTKKWRESKEIELVCVDGYRPVILTEIAKKYDGYLAYERVGSDKFTVKNTRKGGSLVKLSPFYLIWDNKKQPEVNTKGGSLWSYQVKQINIKKEGGSFQAIRPQKSASQAVQEGFIHFKKHCVSCHSVSGYGGNIGPDLTKPVNVTRRLKREWMEQWIAHPQKFDPKSKMSALVWSIKDKKKLKKTIFEILSYIETQ